ncbi:MAG: YrhK family protein [Candidatus Microthrix sp.]|nr:YrhK family protein [Candidatus Microthrix sp.]
MGSDLLSASPQPTGWGLPQVPDDWTVVDTKRAGPFVVGAHVRRADGRLVEWRARAHRKRLGLGLGRNAATTPDRVRHRPTASCWWMAGLFAGGSICFALGSLPPFFNGFSPSVVAATFFGGSVLFTSASSIQYDESRATPASIGPGAQRRPVIRRLLGVSPGSLGWWAAAIQLVGTLLFNLSTFAATQSSLDAQQDRRLIWAPDLFGSLCFLVASGLAFVEVNAGLMPRPDGSTGWRIAALNMVGSIAFGVSAVAARYLPTSGQSANIALVNASTFVGALCFLAGSMLLPVEAAKGAPAMASAG